ncbi:MAG: hypothetical protein K8I30_02520, partial [Anaerolineae bacterium]|nr:hypothetical protein [Anaerolineae bacterium]
MSSEPITLARVRNLIAVGEKDTALTQLNTLLREQPNAEAHSLRLRLLGDELEHPALIQDSLAWLERYQPAAMAEAMNQIGAHLLPRLENMREAVEENGGAGQIAALDDLLPLADRFPVVHLVRGLALTDAAMPGKMRSARIFDRRLLHYTPQELTRQAEYSLTRVVECLPAGDPNHADAVQGLAVLHEEVIGNLKAALTWYRQGAQLGLDLSEKVEEVQKTLIKQTITRFTHYIDSLMDAGQLEQAARLLDASGALCDLPVVQVRLADLHLFQAAR